MADNSEKLQPILTAFRQAETDLGRVIDANLTEETRRVERRLSELHRAICGYCSENPAELAAQLRFLVDRIVKHNGANDDDDDYLELCELISRRIAEMPRPAAQLQKVAIGSVDRTQRAGDPFEHLSVAKMVDQATERMSIIGTDFRYLHTSIGNAEFYGTDQTQLAGRHLAEIIGADRFESRTRGFLEVCFSRGVQDYTHPLVVHGQNRIMNCRMSPVRDRHHVLVGALVSMRDMTSSYLGGVANAGQPSEPLN